MLDIEDNEKPQDGPPAGLEIPRANTGGRDEWGLLMRQRAYCDELLACGNMTQAAIIAGYKVNSADVHAADLMKYPNVKRYLAHQQAKIRRDREDRQRRLLEELEILSHSDLDDYVLDPDAGRVTVRPGKPQHATRALSKIKLKTKRYKDNDGNLVVERDAEVAVHSKTASVDMYMKHLGMFPQAGSKLSIEDSEGNTLVIEEVLE